MKNWTTLLKKFNSRKTKINSHERNIIFLKWNAYVKYQNSVVSICPTPLLWSKAGLNSEFSFSGIGCLSKGKESSLPSWIHTFLKSLSTKWNANSPIQYLNSGDWFHFLCYCYTKHPSMHYCNGKVKKREMRKL